MIIARLAVEDRSASAAIAFSGALGAITGALFVEAGRFVFAEGCGHRVLAHGR